MPNPDGTPTTEEWLLNVEASLMKAQVLNQGLNQAAGVMLSSINIVRQQLDQMESIVNGALQLQVVTEELITQTQFYKDILSQQQELESGGN